MSWAHLGGCQHGSGPGRGLVGAYRLCLRSSCRRLGGDELPHYILHGLAALEQPRHQLLAESGHGGFVVWAQEILEQLEQARCSSSALDRLSDCAGQLLRLAVGDYTVLVRFGGVEVKEDVFEKVREDVVHLFGGVAVTVAAGGSIERDVEVFGCENGMCKVADAGGGQFLDKDGFSEKVHTL